MERESYETGSRPLGRLRFWLPLFGLLERRDEGVDLHQRKEEGYGNAADKDAYENHDQSLNGLVE